jgi:hypothetical protein
MAAKMGVPSKILALIGEVPVSLVFVGLIFPAAPAQAAPPPACGTQFQYSCSAATLGGYTVITPLASTGQTQIIGYNQSNSAVFNQTIPFPPTGSAATDVHVQQAVLQADALLAAQTGVVQAQTLPSCSTSGPPCIAPNPGGETVVTNSTTYSYVAVDTPVSQRVDQYSTTLTAILNGSQTVFQQTYALPFSDPAVQAAVSQADAILVADKASPKAPVLTSNPTPTQGSQLSYVLTGVGASGNVSVTSTDTFGPAAITVGDNQTDVFIVLAGQLDINVNTSEEYNVARNAVTTTTYLTTQAYEIDGSGPVTVPALSGWGLAGLALLLTGSASLLLRRPRPSG